MYIHMSAYICIIHISTCMCVYIYIYMYIYICMYVYYISRPEVQRRPGVGGVLVVDPPTSMD